MIYSYSSDNKYLFDDKWRCPNCGTVNYLRVTTCHCGKSKPDIIEFSKLGDWKCSNCNRENDNTVLQCSCGMPKEFNNKWQCYKCGIINENYRYVCQCGSKQSESRKIRPVPIIEKKAERQNYKPKKSKPTTNSLSELEKIEILTKYKQLLDMGVLSNEEFKKKKSELL